MMGLPLSSSKAERIWKKIQIPKRVMELKQMQVLAATIPNLQTNQLISKRITPHQEERKRIH